jgi:hypothetical protein
MIPSSTTATRAPKLALLLLCLLLACLPVATAGAEISYQKESLQEYEQQLAAHQIASATINKKIRSVRVTLKDGRYVLVKYPAHHEPQVAKALEARHVPVVILSPAAADKEAGKLTHHKHKLRYIAGGVLVAVIVIGGGVFLFLRRRRALQD